MQDIFRTQLLSEAILGGNFTIDLTSNIIGGFNPPEKDYVKRLEIWRQQCKHANEVWHGAYCERCDAVWRFPVGGATWIGRTDWVEQPTRSGSDSEAGDVSEPRGGPKLLADLIDSGSVLGIFDNHQPKASQTMSELQRRTKFP